VDVLLVRAGALGDLLLLRRSIAALRRAGHRVRLLAPAAGAALVGPRPAEVEALLPWDGPQTAALLAGTKAGGPIAEALASADAVIAWTRSSDVSRALAGPARRVVAHDPTPPGDAWHASTWLAQALRPFGLDAAVDPPLLSFTREEEDEATARLAGLPSTFLAMHPGSGSPSKNWPFDHFRAFAARWTQTGRWPVERRAGPTFLLSLGPAEAERVVPDLAPAGALVARDWPLRVLGAALARAGLYVGNDSGPSHLAAAAGAPTLALYGPTDPAVWSPVGPRVRTLRARGGAVASLRIDDVLESAAGLTSEASGPPSG